MLARPSGKSSISHHVRPTKVFDANGYSHHHREDFVPGALKSGQLKPAPAPEVVGRGVDSLQAAFDKQKAGVSAKKIVVPF